MQYVPHFQTLYVTMVKMKNNPENKTKTKTNKDENKIKAGLAGAIKSILTLLKRYIKNGPFCRAGCSTLANIIYINGNLMNLNQ